MNRPSHQSRGLSAGPPIDAVRRTPAVSLLLLLPALLWACDTSPSDPTAIETGLQAAKPTDGPADPVTDLAAADIGATSVSITWSQVTDGSGREAWYELRYGPSSTSWSASTAVTSGACATPVKGQQWSTTVTCTVDGLESGTAYDIRVASFRRGEDASGPSATVSEPLTVTTTESSGGGETDDGTTDDGSTDDGSTDDGSTDDGTTDDGSTDDESADDGVTGPACDTADPAWIWCDDFEQDRLGSYFEYDDDGGDFVRETGVGRDGSSGMRARWSTGEVSAGSLKLAFGRTPQSYFSPVDGGTTDYREVYWRVFVRLQDGWTGGGGDKLSRSTIFASSDSWAQAMIAHVWSGSSPDEEFLVIDPASGTDESGNLQTTTYNDFANLRWLGADRGATPLFTDANAGRWYCVEARVRLNSPGSSDGEFQLWIDGQLDAERTGLNWVGSYDDYGINAVFLENYWNSGSPQAQERYLDDFVVSTQPIGC